MASTVERRKIAGYVQTAASGSSAQTLMSNWNQADATGDNSQNRTAVVDVYVEGRGAATGSVNTYHRREVFFLGYNRTLARDVGSLLAAVEEQEETNTADAVVSLSTPKTVIMTLTGPTGGAAEIMDWTWEGTVTITSTPWENPFLILGDLGPSKLQGTMTNMEAADISADSPGAGSTYSTRFEGVAGGNEYMTCGNVLNQDTTSTFSISLWIKTSSVTASHPLAKQGTLNRGYGAIIGGTGYLNFELINTGVTSVMQVYTTNNGFNDGAWHHFVGTWDGNVAGGAAGACLYVDGASEVPIVYHDTLGTNTISNTGSFTIGARLVTADYLVGRVSNVALYNKVLSLAEVQAIYNAGAPPDLLNLATGANLLYWNRMGD